MLALLAGVAAMAPVPVEIIETNDGYQLLRGGEPYYVNGVGGTDRMDLLAAKGGNSMRTWDAGADLQARLDAAHEFGLTITAGIWLGHVRHGFDWENDEDIAGQREKVRTAVTTYRDHPALLMWSLGNEMEVDGNDTETLWTEIEYLAQLTKELDPNRPVMTIVAEISPQKIENIKRFAPSIDILGVNSYGGLSSLPQRLREFGWEKPYMVTEFGPLGPWEREKTEWGAALEQTSTEKAELYASNYDNSILGQPGWCLGSYAFLWGWKQETTPTWFGMFLPSGEVLGSIDEAARAWTGEYPEQRSPQIRRVDFDQLGQKVEPGEEFNVRVMASDPNGDPLTFRWELRPEVTNTFFTGEGEELPRVLAAVTSPNVGSWHTVKAPLTEGPFRLYVYVMDDTGRAASATLPFYVED